jgi:uncharacterized protein (TIRG00374 family)
MKMVHVRAVVLSAIAVAMAVFLYHVDWHATSTYLTQLGPSAPLVLLPYAFVLSCDTLGWKASFEQPNLPFARLWRIRTATEAVSNSLPAGVAVGETLKTMMLTRAFGMPLADAAANVIVSKFALATAHIVFLFCGLWLGASTLSQTGRSGMLGVYVAVLAAFFALLMAGVKLAQNGALSRLLAGLVRIAPARAGSFLARLTEPLMGLDRSLSVLGRLPRAQIAASIACFFVGWLSLAFENWFILSLLTPHASFSAALSMEAFVSIVRMAFFFLPGGFGAQDVSFYALLNLWGLPDAEAVATAFMLIKRAKEVCWIALGYLLLWVRGEPIAQTAAQPATSVLI